MLIVVIVVATALAFDFTNGFHDTANVVATSISTRAMAPADRGGLRGDPELRRRVPLAEVAATIAERRRRTPTAITPLVVFGGLVGAIAWNLITWYFGLPVELVARPDRRHGRRRARGGGAERDLSARACSAR